MSNSPLLLNHLKKITVIDDTLKYGTKSEAIVSAEGRRESDYRNRMRKTWRGKVHVWVSDVRVKMRKYLAVP